MTKFSVFTKQRGQPWVHWGWFDTRKDAQGEIRHQRQFSPRMKARIRNVNEDDDFQSMVAEMNKRA